MSNTDVVGGPDIEGMCERDWQFRIVVYAVFCKGFSYILRVTLASHSMLSSFFVEVY